MVVVELPAMSSNFSNRSMVGTSLEVPHELGNPGDHGLEQTLPRGCRDLDLTECRRLDSRAVNC